MKKIIVVSGANRGIGKEICRQLAEMGHQIIACSRSKEKGEQAALESGFPMDIQELDVTSTDSIDQLSNYIDTKYGKVDVLINNAGIISEAKSISESRPEDYRAVFETNFFGPWAVSAALKVLLTKSEEGRIINVSSIMGAHSELKNGSYAGYKLSKAALNTFTIQLANELESEGVIVNAMHPGWVKTDMGGEGANRVVSKGAETAVWLSIDPEIPNGKFLQDKKVIPW